MKYSKRGSELGYLFVVGGPGGSGSSTIARMLCNFYKLQYIYAGELMRNIAKRDGFASVEEFLIHTPLERVEKYDLEIDRKMIKFSYNKDVLVEGKVFAALAYKYRIPTTVSIWLDCDIKNRAIRKQLKYGGSLSDIEADLNTRYEKDKERYFKVYGIDYSNPKKYNDIVLDTSRMNEYQTFNLIQKIINDGEYLK